MRLLVICCFLDEEQHLPILLRSLAAQTRRPDRLVLVDDGSTDASPALAEAFAAQHDFVTLLRRPPRPPSRDRLAAAGELRAFHWALEQVGEDHDVVTKLDADLDLAPDTFAHLLEQLEQDPGLGLVGPYLSHRGPNGKEREPQRPEHVRGACKVYRRACHEQISPVREILGWDTADEIAARMHGWRTQSFAIPGGDPIHLRTLGSADGLLRGARRWGVCAWGYGAHPLHILLSTVRRLAEPPPVLEAINFLAGYVGAALRRAPRADPDVRAFCRHEQMVALGGQLRAAISSR